MRTEKIVSRLNSVTLRLYLKPEKNRANNLVVSGFPKSGTTWMTQLLASILQLSYSQNRVRFSCRGVALHTHSLSFSGQNNIVYIIRDPREVACSIHRALRGRREKPAGDSDPYCCENTELIDADFCRFALTRFPGSRAPWDSHVASALQRGWEVIYFEDLKTQPVEALRRLAVLQGRSEDRIVRALETFDYVRLQSLNPASPFLNGSSISTWQDCLTPGAKDYIRDRFSPILEKINRYS
jgi:hypothetical protein